MPVLRPSGPRHRLLSCTPSKRSDSTVIGDVLSSLIPSTSSNLRPLVDATLLWGSRSISIPALLDSGSDDSFLDRKEVDRLGLTTETLRTPIAAQSLNGTPLGVIYERTTPATLVVSGNHREAISFLSLLQAVLGHTSPSTSSPDYHHPMVTPSF